MPHKLKRRRQREPWPPPHSAKRPKEIELIRKAARNTPEHDKPQFDPDNLPPGFQSFKFTIPCNSEPKEEGEISLKDWEPGIPLIPAQQTDVPFTTQYHEDFPDDDVDEIVTDEFDYPLNNCDKMFNIKPANLWLAQQALIPAPKQLFGGFWLEGELCLMFADANMGKSLLAVQIGDSISRGAAINPFKMEAAQGPVLYLDFELSAKQFELRYRDAAGTHQFSAEFYRAEYNLQKEMPYRYETFAEYMEDTLAWAIRNTEPGALIIDNITCLSEGSHQAAGTAVSLMKSLKKLQDKNKLSILVLAHTPKRNPAKPLGRDDMGGSKMLMNFADSAFAIGQSYSQPGLRYLKQVKQRSGTQLYGEDNVCLMKLNYQGSFLKYEFCGNGHEQEQLRRRSDLSRRQTVAMVSGLNKQGLSQRQIAAKLCISTATVNRMLNEPAEVETGDQDNV